MIKILSSNSLINFVNKTFCSSVSKLQSIGKKLIFGLLTTIVLLGVIELGIRASGVVAGQAYIPPRLVQVIREGKIEGEFTTSNAPYFQKTGQWIETSPQYRNGNGAGFPASGAMRHLKFKAEPAPGTQRYFLLGGSAALGQHPVDIKIPITWETERLGQGVSALLEEDAISGQIREMLETQGKNAEVFNAGMIAQDSGGVRRIALELLEYNPTGLIIYLGNNEGIGLSYGMQGEQLPWVPEVQDKMRTFHIYRLLSEKLAPARQSFSKPPPPLKGTKPVVLGQLTLTQWRAASEALMEKGQPTDSVYLALQERLKNNLKEIVLAAEAKGVKVYIIPTPPNLNYAPFFDANSPSLVETDIQHYTQLIGKAKQAEQQKQWDTMEKILHEALEIEEHHASAWYLLGTAQNVLKQYPEALESREKALLLDISRKRTLPIYSKTIAELCEKYSCKTSQVHSFFQDEVKKNGLSIYHQYFGDHEHLTPKGCKRIASEFTRLITTEP